MDVKPAEKPAVKAGDIAKIKSKGGDRGPFYVVQIDGDTATLQGLAQFEAPVADLIAG
jgi:hypothetical protein